MGSTSLGSLIEKYGFINLPLRKFFLSEYVMGLKKISDKSMQYRCIENINTLSESLCLGGTSVKDRDSREAKVRTSKPSNEEIEDFLSFEPKNLYSLISHCFIFTAKFTKYKEINYPINGFVIYEMPQFKIKYPYTQSEYLKVLINKKDFKCFIMNRKFNEWCSSILSQQDYKSKAGLIKKTISLEKLFKRWQEIQILSKMENIYQIKIESILLPNTTNANFLISSILSLPKIDNDSLVSQKFDLYGSVLNYDLAFKPSDKSFKNSNIINKIIFKTYIKFPKFLRYLIDLIFNLARSMGFLQVY